MRRSPLALLSVLVAGPVASGAAQGPPERFENLKVLPDTITRQELLGLMGSFTRALGVRCSHCHVGEEGSPLSSYDFPSDDKLTKRKARAMLRMVLAINGEHLSSVEGRADPSVRVECVTCHSGRTTPRQLEDEVLVAYRAGGLDSALATYRSLRERYYGRAAYDFGSVPLTVVADTLRSRGALAAAVTVLALNVEMNASSSFAKRQHGFAAVLHAFLERGIDSGTARYETLRTAYGQDGFPEFGLNSLGYTLLRGGKPAEAVTVFRWATEAFPESANVWDSLGEGQAAVGDTTSAIASYERSLALNPQNENAVGKLKELRARR